ncbi:Uncharacterized membrane protein YhiD, involved in acid resistance [Pelagirhabdus alkalitolerans]|uniref:Uncharacterized membrane protein YhiD, involved in acid resistance n=1 Tax=Pelagirhabdus alkalitolerans TaxID=1612202 RepID=A0A1G6GGY2_9BACI|nr:DUF4956 domain-containing protein [Pelagirhabdus alkalitolerans]SDB81149.1 Uncharacterized membrane protein YhiD, involved in acid resistance [Pelagirhabdus alkalitolerans]
MLYELSSTFFVEAIHIMNLVVSISLAIILGIGIAFVYKYTHRGMNYERSFLTTLVLISPIVTMVMYFIQGDLVISLGLVGSLSIVRFRTPIKDTRDMVFLFWTIAVGLGAGTYNWTVTIVASIIVAIVVTFLFMVKYGTPLHAEFVLVVTGQLDGHSKDLEDIIKRYATNAQVRSHDVHDEHWEIIFELKFLKNQDNPSQDLLNEIKQINGVEKVSLLAPQLALPM